MLGQVLHNLTAVSCPAIESPAELTRQSLRRSGGCVEQKKIEEQPFRYSIGRVHDVDGIMVWQGFI